MRRPSGRVRTVAALAAWGFLAWILLTWTLTLEQLVVGAVVAIVVAVALAPLGPAVGPWWFFTPRRLVGTGRLLLLTAVRVVIANVKLSIRIWRPSRPLASGMVIVATHARTEGELAAVGIISSVVVDNQIVDIDRRTRHLQYHAVSVPAGSRRLVRTRVNGPVETLIEQLEDPHD
jgi:multicomponent Na+:H+ antiporter subunit E